MRKNTFTGIMIGAMLVVAGGVLPSVTSAQILGVDQLQVQINALLEQVRILRNQLSTLEINRPTPPVPPVVVPPVGHRVCSALYRDLQLGIQGDDVMSLQEFLRSKGYLTSDPAGFFGSMTFAAVSQWQTSEGILVEISFGPVSRERIKRLCDGSPVVSGRLLTATPTSGQAPLTVNFDAHVSIANPQMVADMGRYKIRFGDGAEQVFTCTWALPQCTAPQYASHTYSNNGSYTASLLHFGYYGPVGGPPEKIMESVVINVGTSTPIVPQVVQMPQRDPPIRPRICRALYRNLVRGLQGDDVRSLQEFLQSQKFLRADPTGFFGEQTSRAIASWQRAEGVPALGLFGPLSRKRIRMLCDGGTGGGVAPHNVGSVAPSNLNASPNLGGEGGSGGGTTGSAPGTDPGPGTGTGGPGLGGENAK